MNLENHIGTWVKYLEPEFKESYMDTLSTFVTAERKKTIIYPESSNTFRIFKDLALKDIDVVIIGEEPFHNGTANGRAFDNKSDTLILNPSLDVIMKKVENEACGGFNISNNFCLDNWVKQGVFLLNKILTVEKGKPNNHKGKGWELFTNKVVDIIDKNVKCVFLLWGADAQALRFVIKNNPIIECEHPAKALYEKREWDNKDCFLKANQGLIKYGKDPINWCGN